jgi:hypothetical protein
MIKNLRACVSTSGKPRESADERDGQQAGDPALAAKAIIAVTEVEHPPLRLILSADAVEGTRSKLTQVCEGLEAWESASVSRPILRSRTSGRPRRQPPRPDRGMPCHAASQWKTAKWMRQRK